MPARDKAELLGVDMLKNDLRHTIADFLLTAEENFIQLHGGRGIGKSYTTQKTVINDCLFNNREFILTVPTKKLMEQGILKKWTAKCLAHEFDGWQTHSTIQYLYMRRNEDEDWTRVGQCLPLSGAEDAKNDSSVFRADWMIWDEAMRIEINQGLSDTLIELFLAAYHTVDRDENRVKAVFLGNALNKTDPLYTFFGVDMGKLKKPGTVVRAFNRISWYVPMPKDLEDPDNKFRKMISGTRYGDIATGKFDLTYGYLIADPGEALVTSCYAIQFIDDSCLLVMMSSGNVYIQSCKKDFAEKYASQFFVVSFKDATKERPVAPIALIDTIRYALAAGRCKFVDEESLLIGAGRLKSCYNIPVLG